jgi:hypothetical protein
VIVVCIDDWIAVRDGNENVGYTYSQKGCIVVPVRLLGLPYFVVFGYVWD